MLLIFCFVSPSRTTCDAPLASKLTYYCYHLQFSAGKTVSMPNWFGNNVDSVERCFPASS